MLYFSIILSTTLRVLDVILLNASSLVEMICAFDSIQISFQGTLYEWTEVLFYRTLCTASIYIYKSIK